MKIQLTNKTQYRDDDLRAIVQGACKAAGVRLRVLRLTVTSSRCGSVTGYAYYPTAATRSAQHTSAMRLRVPPPSDMRWTEGRRHLAQVALHEAMHLNGARHSDMTEEQYNCTMPVPWSDALELRVKEAKPKPQPVDPEARKAAARAGRLEHAQKMLAKAQTRLKRASTIEKKWKRRVGGAVPMTKAIAAARGAVSDRDRSDASRLVEVALMVAKDQSSDPKPEALIRLHFYDAPIVTTAEYEVLQRELESRVMAQDAGLAERILFRLLRDQAWRYHEAKEQNAARDSGSAVR